MLFGKPNFFHVKYLYIWSQYCCPALPRLYCQPPTPYPLTALRYVSDADMAATREIGAADTGPPKRGI